ncbi:MAG: bis(5'-nucleosyl)-tetraphosphatase [Spirochaetota bacterium]
MELSAGVVVVRREGGGWRYLLLRAYRNWDFPKGTVQEGEDPLQTARREVAEETGIRELHFRWGEAFVETEPYRGGKKKARYYLAETPARELELPVSPELGRPEHHEYRWVDPRELDRLAPARLGPVIRWARRLVES